MHLANTTNHRLESHNQKLKDLTLHLSSLCEMFQNVFNFMQISASEYSQATFTEEFTTVSTLGEEFASAGQIRNSCTHYAAEMLIEQLQLSKTVSYTVQARSEGTYIASSSQNSYNVGKENQSCTCSFHKMIGMPCCHIFLLDSILRFLILKFQWL